MTPAESTYTYDDLARRLDPAAIVAAAEEIRRGLDAGLVVGHAYQPGDGTSYDLVLVPYRAIAQSAWPSWSVPQGLHDSDGKIREGWVLVSKVNGETWSQPFDLTPGWTPHWSYVRDKTDGNPATAAALTALFRAIAGEAVLDADAA